MPNPILNDKNFESDDPEATVQHLIQERAYARNHECVWGDVATIKDHQTLGLREDLEQRFRLGLERSVFVVAALENKFRRSDVWSEICRIGFRDLGIGPQARP